MWRIGGLLLACFLAAAPAHAQLTSAAGPLGSRMAVQLFTTVGANTFICPASGLVYATLIGPGGGGGGGLNNASFGGGGGGASGAAGSGGAGQQGAAWLEWAQ